jgi:curved DNA-binding protein CbpA
MAQSPVTEDYYAILEVDQTATPELITKSYRRLALKAHPDRHAHGGSTQLFQLVR